MRLESQRTLVTPNPPDEVWRLLSDPASLPVLAPEIEDAWVVRGGLLRVVARLGKRRRAWKVKVTLDEPKHRLEIESASAEVTFHLEAAIEPSGSGSSVRILLKLEPPAVWKAHPQPALSRRFVQRLVLSFVLFALSAAGVVELPSMHLEPLLGAVAYGIVGAAFLVGAALLSSAHNPRQPRARKRLLSKPG